MTKAQKAELLDYLTNNEYGVQSILDSHDWLGTGSCSRTADKEQREAQEKLDAMVKLLKESK